MDFIDLEAKERIERRGISLDDITYCINNPTSQYVNRRNVVYCAALLDGRNLKVEMNQSKIVINAFCHM